MRKLLPALLILAAAPPGLAQDFDSSFRQPHFYLGADVGESTIRDNSLGFEQHGIGFDLRAGIRPIPFLGAEIEYVDLDRDHRHDAFDCAATLCGYGTEIRAQGGAAFGLLYLPIPHSLFDLYAKAGAARLQTRTTSSVSLFGACPADLQPCPFAPTPYRNDTTNTDFAWGAGVQVHWWNFAFRGEFQQFRTPGAHPNLVSAGFIWGLW